ncbi:MAG: peptidase M28, partial [Myxococcota bacterium]
MTAASPGLKAQPASAPSAAPVDREKELITNARQLIFEGLRSGEGYFSADGQSLIFQSERDATNPFYQIYVVDLETGDVDRVSPGHGKTTCSWIHPQGKGFLFSSTHDDPDAKKKMKAELDFRASGKSRRYSWDYDEHYDLYYTADRKKFVNLTKVRGYDAEGSYSPDGQLIAFASNRRAYSTKMSDAEKKGFEHDPAYMMDIYIMKADGSGVERLTKTPGYDGGPFFSPDGQRIVWRRFNPEGDKAEVWSMKIDGTDKRQITELNHMSWAPYYHPTGDYLIFTTNVHGFDNFELYIVDAAGTKKPVRVTYTKGFDGLPVFSPDGQRVVWSTTRTPTKRSQLFTADWDDAAARRLLSLAPLRGKVAYKGGAESVAAELTGTSAKFTADDVQRHVVALTSVEMDGRLTGTSGEARATAYVADVFKKLGLEPAGDDGFFQPFEFTSGVKLGSPNVLVVEADGKTSRPPVDKAWRPLAFSKPGSIGRSEL